MKRMKTLIHVVRKKAQLQLDIEVPLVKFGYANKNNNKTIRKWVQRKQIKEGGLAY